MKKIVKSFLMIAMTMAVIVGCGKKEQPEASGSEPLEVSVTVTEIADNKAVVTASIVSGEAASGKIVTNYPMTSVDFDYEMEISLINVIEKEGQAMTFPYTVTLENVRDDFDYISAVLVYDETGRAAAAASCIWTGDGIPDGWSQDNSAGQLEPNEW